MGQDWDDVVSREGLRGSTVRPLELAGLDCNNYRSVFAESTPASHTALDIDPNGITTPLILSETISRIGLLAKPNPYTFPPFTFSLVSSLFHSMAHSLLQLIIYRWLYVYQFNGNPLFMSKLNQINAT